MAHETFVNVALPEDLLLRASSSGERDNAILSNRYVLGWPRTELIRELQNAVQQELEEGGKILIYPFGFMRLQFMKHRKCNGYCLHIWMSDLVEEDYPHAHIFDMDSRLLSGSMRNLDWHVDPSPDGEHVCYWPEHRDDIASYQRFPGRYRLTLKKDSILRSGDTYTVAKGAFHSSFPVWDGTPVITLIRKTNIDPDGAPVNVLPADRPHPSAYKFTPFSQEEALRRLESALNAL